MENEIRNVSLVPEGDGVDVKRLFPVNGFMNFDPFVLWDHFDIGSGRGFPDHPHRGFEAITYMFDGGMNHKDNLGNESFVTAGGAQRFTAGSGMVHSEMPAQQGSSKGIQLWINLPRRLKKIAPDYQQVDADEFPIKQIEGGQVKILVGEGSPLKLHTQIIYQHVTLNPKGRYRLNLPSQMRAIIYVLNGRLNSNGKTINRDQAFFMDSVKQLDFIAEGNSEFMICAGVAHHEPIRQYGPFVD